MAANQITLAASSSSSLTIPTFSHTSFSVKLNSYNYLAWKTQMIPLFNSHNLLGFINGTTLAPSQTVMNTATLPEPITNPEFWMAHSRKRHPSSGGCRVGGMFAGSSHFAVTCWGKFIFVHGPDC